MNRYTGTARRIIAAISCAAMVVSNMGSSITTITAYADEIDTADLQNTTATDGATTPTGDTGNTGDNSGTSNDGDAGEIVVEPIVQEETDEVKAVETPEEKKENTSDDTSNEEKKENTSDDTSNEEKKETTSDDTSNEEKKETNSDDTSNEEKKENTSTGTSDEEKKENTSDDTSTEDKKEDASNADTTDEKKDESSDAKSNKLTGFEEDEETETKVTDETANITFEADYIGYYYDYVTVTDEETGEETEEEQQLTKTIHDSQTLEISKDNAYAAGADTAPTIDGWAYDYITIDDEDYYDGASIAIVDEKDETNNTETIYYTVDGNRIPASTESRTIKITYLYMSTENTDGETLALSEHELTVDYRVSGTSFASILTDPYIEYWDATNGKWVKITTDVWKNTLGGTDQNFPKVTIGSAVYVKASLPDTLPDSEEKLVYRLNGTVASGYTTAWLNGDKTIESTDKNATELTINENASLSGTIKWNDGNNSYSTRLLQKDGEDGRTYGVTEYVDGTGTPHGGQTEGKDIFHQRSTDPTDPYYFKQVAYDKEGNELGSTETDLKKAAYWIITYPNLPKYDADGKEIKYYITPTASKAAKDVEGVDNTHYEVQNTNPTSNDTDKVYLGTTKMEGDNIASSQPEGGVADFTLTGKTSYTTTKQWIDDGETAHSATAGLYRYPDGITDKDGKVVGTDEDAKGYQVASAVKGDYLNVSLTKASTVSDVTVDVKDKENDKRCTTTITIGETTTTSGDGDSTQTTTEKTLEAFNQDGYKYNYVLKEKVGEGYSTMYWDSTNKKYVAVDGSFVVNASSSNATADQKTFYNVNTTTTSQSYTKTFDAKAIQDEKYAVEIKLWQTTDEETAKQKKTEAWTDEDGNKHPAATQAQDADGEAVTAELSGFDEKKTTDSGSFSGLSVYNTTDSPNSETAGQKLYYFVTEGTVTKLNSDGTKTSYTAEPTTGSDGKTYIVIEDGKGGKYRYEQIITSDEDGQTITNKLVANAVLNINKTFPNGFGWKDDNDHNKGQKDSETVVYAVYGEDKTKPIGYYKATYTKIDEDGKVSTPAIEKYSDLYKTEGCKDNDHLEKTGYFERYDENGKEIEYSIREVSADYKNYSVHTTSSHKDGKYGEDSQFEDEYYLDFTGNITNYLEGGGATIKVHKDWVDDGMSMYRQDLKFDIEMRLTIDNGTESDWKTIASGTIKTDETDAIVGITNKQINDAFSISYANADAMVGGWQDNGYKAKEITLTEDGTTHKVTVDIRVRETEVGPTSTDADGNKIGTVTHVESAESDNITNPEHVKGKDFVMTAEQNYDITYETRTEYKDAGKTAGEDPADYFITNTRVGTVTATFDKTWVDGNDQLGERPEKISVTLRATVNGEPYNVWYDSDDNELNPATGEKKSESAAAVKGSVPSADTVYRETNKTMGASEENDEPAALTATEKGSQRVYELTASSDKAGDNEWKLVTDNLRKYTDKGEVITYTVVNETIYKKSGDTYVVDANSPYTTSYGSMDEVASSVGAHHTDDKEIFKVKNSLTDTVDLVIHKVWEDDGTAASVAKRPDIYPAVYRAVKKAVTDDDKTGYDATTITKLKYIPNDWTQEKETDNWWKIVLTGQPRYADGSETYTKDGKVVAIPEGTEFVYFIGEEWSAAVRNDYVQAGAFTIEPNTTDNKVKTNKIDGKKITLVDFSSEEAKDSGYRTTVTIDGNEVVMIQPTGKKVDNKDTWTTGTLVNRATLNLSGTKVWESKNNDYAISDMPTLYFTLWRLDADTAKAWKEAGHTGTGTNNTNWDGVFDAKNWNGISGCDGTALPAGLEQVTTNSDGYAFSASYTSGSSTKTEAAKEQITWPNGLGYSWSNLRKSNEKGDYVYLIKETLASSETTGDSGYQKIQDTYTFTVIDGSDGYRATNTYNPALDYKVTFTKDWSVPDASKFTTTPMNPQPAVVVGLYRAQKKSDGTLGDLEFVNESTVTMTVATEGATTETAERGTSATLTFKTGQDVTSTDRTKQTDTVTWSNLPSIAPNLNKYVYFVRETSAGVSLEGMEVATTTWTEAEITADSNKFHKYESNNTLINATVEVKGSDSTETGKTIKRADGTTATTSGTISIGNAELSNTYGNVKGAIKVQKVWESSATTETTKDSSGDETIVTKYPGAAALKKTLDLTNYKVDPTNYPELAIEIHRKGGDVSDQTLQDYEMDSSSDTSLKAKVADGDKDWYGYINNIEEHSSRGYEYTYWFKESVKGLTKDGFDLLKYYKEDNTQNTAVAKHWDKDAEGAPATWSAFDGTITDTANIAVLTNTPIMESLTISKTWQKQKTGENAAEITDKNALEDLYKLGALPDSITYTVQYKLGTDGTWSDLMDSNGTVVTVTGSREKGDNGVAYTTGTKTIDYTYAPNTDDKNYEILSTLPSYVFTETSGVVTAATAVSYRAVETKMTYNALTDPLKRESKDIIERTDGKVGTTGTIGSFTVSEETTAPTKDGAATDNGGENKTVVTNTIPVKTLTIRKLWDDEKNRDQKRPDSLIVNVNSKDGAGTGANVTLNKAISKDPSTTQNGWDDNNAYYNYYSADTEYGLSKNNRPMDKYDIWEATLDVPTATPNGTAGGAEYTVKETNYKKGNATKSIDDLRADDNGGYTTYKYGKDSSWSWSKVAAVTAEQQEAGASSIPAVTIGVSEGNFVVTFANRTGTRASYDINVNKKFTYTATGKTWSSGERSSEGWITVTIPAEDEAYINYLKEKGLAFQLRYKVDSKSTIWTNDSGTADANGYKVVSTSGKEQDWGLATGGSIDSYKMAEFETVSATDKSIKFTTAPSKTGYVNFKIRVPSWTSLPKYLYNDKSGTSYTITYEIVEGFYKNNTFTDIAKVVSDKDTTFTNNWKTTKEDTKVVSVVTNLTEPTNNQVRTATFNNIPKFRSVEAKKAWQELYVGADGKADSTINSGNASPATSENLKALEAYQALPQTITYRAEYRVLGDNTDSWKALQVNGKDVTFSGSVDATQTTDYTLKYQYAANTDNLPAYVTITTNGKAETKEIEYRAVEVSANYTNDATKAVVRGTDSTGAYTNTIGNLTVASLDKFGDGDTQKADYAYKTTNTIPVRQITIQKLWDDEENRDDQRVTSLDFKLTRDTNITVDAAKYMGQLTSAKNTVGEGTVDQSAGYNAYTKDNGSVKKAQIGTSLSNYSVWQGTITVPFYQNGTTTASSYTIAESLTSTDSTDIAKYDSYTHRAYNSTTGWSATTKKEGNNDVKNDVTSVTVAADTSDPYAVFANVRTKNTFTIDPYKLFSLTSGEDTLWTSTKIEIDDASAENDKKTVVKVTLPATGKKAIESLNGTMYFQLSYAAGTHTGTVGDDNWKNANGAYSAYQPVTITYQSEDKSAGTLTYYVTVEDFTDLPVYWYEGYSTTSSAFGRTQISYTVSEVFKVGDSYYTKDQIPDATLKGVVAKWNLGNAKSDLKADLNNLTTKVEASITNIPTTITVTANKAWQEDLNGTKTAIYPLKGGSTTEIERLESKYGAIPTSITYQLQYRAATANASDAWKKYDEQTITKTDGSTDYSYTVTWTNLPEIQSVGEGQNAAPAAVVYRIVEKGMSFKDGTSVEATDDTIAAANGSYEIGKIAVTTSEADKDNKITITNTIPMRTLTIEKLWDDEDDRDDLRPETAGLTFKVYRDVTGEITDSTTVSGTASMKQTDKVSALPTDAAYTKYHDAHLNNRIMSTTSVWSTAGQTSSVLTVPTYQNGKSDASVYTVVESGVDSANYTSYAYDETSTAEDKWVSGTTAKTASGLAVFANQHTRNTFSIQPAKFFINNVDNTARWGETQNTTNGIVTSVTYTVPVEDLAYFKKLESHSLAFQLSYELDGHPVTNVHPVTFEYKEDGTVKVSVTPWTNLPINQYNSTTLEPTKITYTVVEGFGSGENFKAFNDTSLDSKIQQTLHDWAFNISGSTTSIVGTDKDGKIVPVQSWAIKNQAGYDSLSITKNWTGVVDGNSSNTLTEAQVKAYDARYGFMPDSITYQIQYRAKGTTGAWSDYDYKGDASLVGLKTNNYAVTIPYLPAFTTSGTSSIQVEYRAVEKSLTYGTTVVPAEGETAVTYTDQAAKTGCNNTTTGTIGGFQSTSNTTYPNDEATKGTTTNGYSTNIINTVSFNTLTVEKLWDDEENRDELRPTSISIEVRRDGNTGNADDTVVLTQDKAVASLTDNNAPYKAYKDQKILGNRPMTGYSVWSDTILVPAAQNTSTTASQYVITEQFADETTNSTNYKTVYYYNGGAWSDTSQNVTISASKTGFVAAFANRHDKLALTINPQKTFTDTAANWSTATDEEGNIAENADGSITITIPTADDGYINVLRQYTLAFELAYSLDGTTYEPVNPEDVDIWGLDKATDLKAVHEVTLTAPTETADGKSLTFTSKINDWTDLPLYLYADHSKKESTQQQIQYMVEEGFVINGTFYSIAEITNKDQSEIKAADKTAAEEIAEVLNDWKAPSPEAVAGIRATKDTETDQRTIKAAINNAPQKVDVQVSKAWQQTDDVDAAGNIIAGTTLDAADYAYLEKWGALPTSITYQIQYRAKSDNKGVNATWYDYEDGEDKGLLNAKAETKADGTTDYTFAASRKSLPAFMDINGTATEVYYRVIESQLTYADGSVAKVHNNDVTFKAAADSNANSVDAVYYDTLSLQGRENTERTTGIDDNTSAAYTTAVTNIVKLRALTIEKIWDDEENRDGNREETLSFQIKRDVQSGEAETFTGSMQTVTMYKDAAVEQEADKDLTDVGTTVKGVPTDANDPANIYKAAHSERSIEGNSIWNKTVTVPYGANTGLATSTYKVVEVVPETMTTNLYTTQAYAGGGADGWKDGNALTGKTVGTTNPIAAFANIRNKDTFHVQPVKDWQYLGATTTDKWVNVEDNVETIDAEAKAYFEMLQSYEFGFILTYKTGDMKEFLPVDVNPNGKSADEDKAVVQQLGDLYSVHLVDFTFDPADTTDGKVTMTTNVEPWENLPYYWYDAKTLESTPIEYQVREGFMIDDKFVTVEDFFQDEDTPVTASVLGAISGLGNKVKAALGNDAAQTREALNTALKAWTSMTDTSPVPMTGETKVANVAKGATYSAPFQNEFATNRLTVTKEWDDDENSAGLRPQTLRYVVTYALADQAADETAYTPVPDAWLNDVNTEDGIGLEDVTIDGVATRYVTVDVAADGKTAATAVITGLPLTNEQGETYAYEAYELEDESIEIYSSETVTTANKDGSFTTAIKNTLFTVNATIDKTWDDPFGFTDNVHDTTYTLQRIEYIMGEDFTEVTGDWQNVTYADLAGAKDNTGAKIDKTGAADGKTASDAYTVTIAGVSPETISLTMLRGIKGRNENGDLVLYAYRFVESSMVVTDDRQTKGTTAAAASKDDLTQGTDGGYLYSSTFEQEKGTLPFEVANNLNKTYHTHIVSKLPRAQVVAIKWWDDQNNADGVRPNGITVDLAMTLNTHENTIDFAPKDANVADQGEIKRENAYQNHYTWAGEVSVPVCDAYGDVFTYTFTEPNIKDYEITSIPDSFQFSQDGQTATVEWTNYHFVAPYSEPEHTDDTPVPPTTPTKKVVPVEDPQPTEETTDETPGGDESSSESTSDPRGPRVEGNTNWGYYDEYGNWHWLDEEGSIGTGSGDGGDEMGDGSLMNFYGIVAAMSATVLAAWFVLYRRKREE